MRQRLPAMKLKAIIRVRLIFTVSKKVFIQLY
jgi:hypothetical protein